MTKFCPKCQAETERNTKGDCKPCAIIRTKKWVAENRQKHNARVAKWQKNNPDYLKERVKRYRAKNSELIKQREKAKRLKDPEKFSKRSREYAKKHPDKVNARNAERRARRKNQSGIVSKNIIEKLKNLQKNKCPCCSMSLGDKFHLDHIVPLVLGGMHEDSNLQLLRSTCNQQKHAKHPIDFMQSRGFLL